MKSIRNLFAAVVLASVLAHAAMAEEGIIHGDFTPPPPPPPPPVANATDEASDASQPSDAAVITVAVEVALELASNALALF